MDIIGVSPFSIHYFVTCFGCYSKSLLLLFTEIVLGVSRQSGPTFICKIIICCSSCHSRLVLTRQTVCIWCLFAAS